MDAPNSIALAKEILLDLVSNIEKATNDQMREIVRLKRELESLTKDENAPNNNNA